MEPHSSKKRRVEREESSYEALQAQRDSAKAVILKSVTASYGKDFWKDLPSEWKNDREVAFAALTAKTIKANKQLSTELQKDRQFLASAVSENSLVWLHLPDAFKNDIDFVRSLTAFTDDEAIGFMFEKFPSLCSERNIWLTIFKKPLTAIDYKYYNLLSDYAPPTILSDREIMILACNFDDAILEEFVLDSLAHDRNFWVELLGTSPKALRCMSGEAQRMYPDLVLDALPRALKEIHQSFTTCSSPFRGSVIRAFASQIAEDLWVSNRSIVRAYFQSGGAFLPEDMQHLKADREVFLWMAKHIDKEDGAGFVTSFRHALPSLTNEKTFMLQAIELNPNAYHAAAEDLRKDFGVWLVAFGSFKDRHPHITKQTWTATLRQSITEFVPRVKAELQRQETFFQTLLFGMAQNPRVSQTPLALLNQGEATAVNYKRAIAEYLDVPTGKRLRMLRESSRNLASVLAITAQL